MLHHPLQHAGIGQSGHYDEQYADDYHRRGAEAREGLLGIEHTGDEEYADGPEKH